jgi:hypothetical protein
VYLVLALLVVTGGLFLKVHDHAVYCGGSAMPVICPLRCVFSQGCPGCGLTRSIVAFFHLQWGASLSFHPAGWLVAAACLVQLPCGVLLLSGKVNERFNRRLEKAGRLFWTAVLLLSFFWWLWKII